MSIVDFFNKRGQIQLYLDAYDAELISTALYNLSCDYLGYSTSRGKLQGTDRDRILMLLKLFKCPECESLGNKPQGS
jgi:hypothetical protein